LYRTVRRGEEGVGGGNMSGEESKREKRREERRIEVGRRG
jgi:hypothetical protein